MGFHGIPLEAEWRMHCSRREQEQGAQAGGGGDKGRGEKRLDSRYNGGATGSAGPLGSGVRGRVQGPPRTWDGWEARQDVKGRCLFT